MNLVEKIKFRQNIDPIEVFDISDTKETVDNNYNAFVNEISQMKNDEQKRVENVENKFSVEIKAAADKDNKQRLKHMKISITIFFLSLFFALPILLKFSLNTNIYKYITVNVPFFVVWINIISLLMIIFSFCFFIYTTIKSNYKDNQKKAKKNYIITKDKGSLTDKINLYIFVLMELTEICKLFNNPELKQSEIVSNILALKTNYETRKFQQEMLNKKEQEIELQRKIAEYNRYQMEEQQRQTEYAKQQMQSQQRQEDLVRQEQQRRNNRY